MLKYIDIKIDINMIFQFYSTQVKKIFLILILAFTVFMTIAPISSWEPVVYADNLPPGGLNDEHFMFNLEPITHDAIKEQNWIRGGVNFVFQRIITIMAATIGSAAVLMITIGGFMILASGGRQQWLDTGKSLIFKSLIGLAVTLGAYIIVTAVQLLIKSIYG